MFIQQKPMPEKRIKKASIKGILLGAITDIVSTNVVVIPVIIYVIHTQTVMGVPVEKAVSLVPGILRDNSILYFYLVFGLGGLSSVLGGYVGARIAKHDEILNGTLTSFLCVANGIYTLIWDPTHAHSPQWQNLISMLLAPMLAALGGYLRLRQIESKDLRPFQP